MIPGPGRFDAMYAKPDSTPMTARVARAGDAMDAALKSLSYPTADGSLPETVRDLNGMRNDNAPALTPVRPVEVAPQPPSAQRVPNEIALGRPSREEAEAAVRTLLRWAGDDPRREGLIDTPARVARAYREWFAGYEEDPVELLARSFEETEGYDEMVVLRDIRLESTCEHHLAPIVGRVHLAYLPNGRVVGISKLARVVEAYARRLQIQEKLTAQIANSIQEVLQPKGVAVVVEAAHQCMTTRGVHMPGVTMVTSRMLGAFRDDAATRQEFMAAVGVVPGATR